ncbi:MAG: DNA internalization-related competence protein ComEC/Rec2 [Candidatus Aminicenantes bacterium]|nr:DNA internalization-related competence protein ComEC/Rec2 [Candidatus Aminicenantes bacterium]
MRNIFAPIFLLSLFLLYTCHSLNPNAAIVRFVMLLAFLSALGCRFLGKYIWSYLFIAFSIGLLITSQFLKEKEEFYRVTRSVSAFHIPAEEYATLYGQLKSFPEIGNDESILTLETHFLEYRRQKIPVHFFTRLNVKGDGDLKHLYWGDHIAVSARIFSNRFNRNFYPNSMEDYVLSKKIHFNGSCKSVQMVAVEQETWWAWKLIGKWRNMIRDAIDKKYTGPNGELDPKGVFLEATLLGEQGKLGAEQKDQLLSAGVYHIFAISGANIAVIALFSLMFLKFLHVSFRKRYIITGLLLVVFLILSGMTVSAERAVWMALLIFLARILYLEIDIFNIISFAGLIILMKNPGQFLDAGFILTFTLTAAIVIGRKIFLPLLSKWKVLRLNTHTYINELLSANLSAAVISLPLSLLFFKQYSFVGFFAGLLLLPLTGIITAGGVLLIALPLISSRVSGVLLLLLDIPLRVFYYIAALFSRAADVFLIYRASPPVVLVVSILIAFYLLSVSRSKFHKLILGLFILAGISYMCITIFYYTPKDLEVFYLDVGQGDSQVVVFPGGDALLIDAGGAYYSSDARVGMKTVLPFLLEKRIKIKWAAISHFHPDHARGIAEIIRIIKPEELWISSEPGADLAYEQLSRDLPAAVAVKILHAPFNKTVGPGGPCSIEILAPDQTIKGGPPRNNHSQVIKISGPYHTFLFTGDIEAEVETRLADTDCPRLRADVIKVPHHGSRTSSGVDFLKCVAPRCAVFSYAQGNRFNFPHKETMRNYKSQGIKCLSTARSGGIRIVSLPGALEIETSK